jgi:STE24 endopeptidase
VPLGALLLPPLSARMRDVAGSSPAMWMLLLVAAQGVALLPAAWYRGLRLEREYSLSGSSAAAWFRDYLKGWLIGALVMAAAIEGAYAAMRVSQQWWWLIAASGGTLLMAALTSAAPVLLVPLFFQTRSLARETLHRRLIDLCGRAGVRVLAVHELVLGGRSSRANAALVGAGATRRILVSDTLLSAYTDDEIEVVLAHELGHHRHADVLKGLVLEFVVLAAGLYAGDAALRMVVARGGLLSPGDVAGVPVVLLSAGAVSMLATPLLNAWSRRNERRADRLALELTGRPDAFIAAVRRMAAQNLVEEHPPRFVRWLLNTHPTVEARIAAARRFSMERKQADGVTHGVRATTSAAESRSSAEPAGV